MCGDLVLVGNNPGNTLISKGDGALGQQHQRVQEVVDNHGLEHIELQVTLRAYGADEDTPSRHLSSWRNRGGL